MGRQIRLSEIGLVVGLCFILIFMLVHDWLPLGNLNHVQAIAESRSASELIVVTLIGAFQILWLLVLALWFIGKKYPLWVKLWLILHQACILAGAIVDWWLPYLFGYGAAERAERYQEMFGQTHAFLTVQNGIVPNTIHVMFHSTLLICLLVTIYLSMTRSKHQRSEVSMKKSVRME